VSPRTSNFVAPTRNVGRSAAGAGRGRPSSGSADGGFGFGFGFVASTTVVPPPPTPGSPSTPPPMPDLCAYDGQTADLVVTRDRVGTTYLAEDTNCLHRKDVRYAKSVGAVLAWFDAHVRLPGASP